MYGNHGHSAFEKISTIPKNECVGCAVPRYYARRIPTTMENQYFGSRSWTFSPEPPAAATHQSIHLSSISNQQDLGLLPDLHMTRNSAILATDNPMPLSIPAYRIWSLSLLLTLLFTALPDPVPFPTMRFPNAARRNAGFKATSRSSLYFTIR